MCNTLLRLMMPEILSLTILTLVLLIVVSVVNKDCKAYLLSKKVVRPIISFLLLLGIISVIVGHHFYRTFAFPFIHREVLSDLPSINI